MTKIAPKSLKLITLYLMCYLLVEVALIIYKFNGWNSHHLSHFYFIPQFILLSLFYKTLFSSLQKKLVNILMFIVFSILTIQYIIHPNLLVEINPFEIAITCGVLVIFPIIHLFNSLAKKGEYMYINAGILFYISLSTLLFIIRKISSTEGLTSLYNPTVMINKVLVILYITIYYYEYKKTIWKRMKK